MSYYPDWLDRSADLPAQPVGVNWDALPDGWRDLNPRLSRPDGLDRRGHANLVRAKVGEGLIDPANLGFADWLEGLT